jgi:hypothetical protein
MQQHGGADAHSYSSHGGDYRLLRGCQCLQVEDRWTRLSQLCVGKIHQVIPCRKTGLCSRDQHCTNVGVGVGLL